MHTIAAAIFPIAILALGMSLLTQWVDHLKAARQQSTHQADHSTRPDSPKS